MTPSPSLTVSLAPESPPHPQLPSRHATMDDAPLAAPPVPAPAPAPAPPAAAPRVPFHCSECGKSFRYRSDLRRHFARHTALKPHACPRCGKGFKHSFNLANHLRSHTGERPYRCSACPKGFRDSTGLLHHQVSPAGPSGCPRAGRAFGAPAPLWATENFFLFLAPGQSAPTSASTRAFSSSLHLCRGRYTCPTCRLLSYPTPAHTPRSPAHQPLQFCVPCSRAIFKSRSATYILNYFIQR